MAYESTHIADLPCLKVAGNEETAIVLLHGYGASCSDLAPLHQFPRFPKATWYFPDGPFEVPIAPGILGRAWFPIDNARLEAAMREGRYLDWRSEVPQGLAESSEQVGRLFEELSRRHSRLFVGGFSQGAMVSSDAVLAADWDPAALILLSTTLIARARWEARLEAHQRLRVFQCHGNADPLLSETLAKDLHHMFVKAGLDARWYGFKGGHQLPPDALYVLADFLARLCATAPAPTP